eukprot:TRINITY_DN10044_c2_g1_i1.p1 TRINITY_DN10044_c2_g1~~TRINITY_DN10044_c2_g1_i1.p1  ORF type:complete len:956 (+),score=256.90 TRINITY_DN10044_c2_g1_i1:33-2870(+)
MGAEQSACPLCGEVLQVKGGGQHRCRAAARRLSSSSYDLSPISERRRAGRGRAASPAGKLAARLVACVVPATGSPDNTPDGASAPLRPPPHAAAALQRARSRSGSGSGAPSSPRSAACRSPLPDSDRSDTGSAQDAAAAAAGDSADASTRTGELSEDSGDGRGAAEEEVSAPPAAIFAAFLEAHSPGDREHAFRMGAEVAAGTPLDVMMERLLERFQDVGARAELWRGGLPPGLVSSRLRALLAARDPARLPEVPAITAALARGELTAAYVANAVWRRYAAHPDDWLLSEPEPATPPAQGPALSAAEAALARDGGRERSWAARRRRGSAAELTPLPLDALLQSPHEDARCYVSEDAESPRYIPSPAAEKRTAEARTPPLYPPAQRGPKQNAHPELPPTAAPAQPTQSARRRRRGNSTRTAQGAAEGAPAAQAPAEGTQGAPPSASPAGATTTPRGESQAPAADGPDPGAVASPNTWAKAIMPSPPQRVKRKGTMRRTGTGGSGKERKGRRRAPEAPAPAPAPDDGGCPVRAQWLAACAHAAGEERAGRGALERLVRQRRKALRARGAAAGLRAEPEPLGAAVLDAVRAVVEGPAALRLAAAAAATEALQREAAQLAGRAVIAAGRGDLIAADASAARKARDRTGAELAALAAREAALQQRAEREVAPLLAERARLREEIGRLHREGEELARRRAAVAAAVAAGEARAGELAGRLGRSGADRAKADAGAVASSAKAAKRLAAAQRKQRRLAAARAEVGAARRAAEEEAAARLARVAELRDAGAAAAAAAEQAAGEARIAAAAAEARGRLRAAAARGADPEALLASLFFEEFEERDRTAAVAATPDCSAAAESRLPLIALRVREVQEGVEAGVAQRARSAAAAEWAAASGLAPAAGSGPGREAGAAGGAPAPEGGGPDAREEGAPRQRPRRRGSTRKRKGGQAPGAE